MKHIKNNPFLFLSLASLIALHLSMTVVVFILMSLPREMISSTKAVPSIFALEGIYFNFLLPIVIIFGLFCIGIGFKKGENKKGLFISLIVNQLFLVSIVGNTIA